MEIAAGAAFLANFYAGDAAILLLGVIVTAIVTTKIPILLGTATRTIQPYEERLPLWLCWVSSRSAHGPRPCFSAWRQSFWIPACDWAAGNARTSARGWRPHAEHRQATLAEVFGFFCAWGLTAFGGPAAHIALMEREAVERARMAEPGTVSRPGGRVQSASGPELHAGGHGARVDRAGDG